MRRPALIQTLLSLALTTAALEALSPAGPEIDYGRLIVQLEPFPQAAERLELRVEMLSAVAEDGSQVPLELRVRELRARELTDEIQLASGSLPPGLYTGLAIRVSAAGLQHQEGAAALASDSEPVPIDVPFRIERRQGIVLDLSFDLESAVEADFSMTPAFVGSTVGRPPVGTLGLVSSPDDGSVTLFDKISGSVTGIVPTSRSPRGMALDEERRLAYVALTDEERVIVVGLLEPRILNSLRLNGGDRPTGLALSPDGSLLLSANSGSRTVSVIDALSMVEIERLTVGDRPRSVLVDARGARAYVFNTAASSVSVLDVRNRRVLATIATEAEPFWGQLDRSGDVLYVVHGFAPFVTVIDTATLGARRQFIGDRVTAIEVDPRTDLIYLAIEDARTIDVYDPLSFLPVDAIPTAGEASFLTIDGELNHLHVVLPELRQLHILRLVGKKTVARVDLGSAPYWATLFGER